MLAECCSNCFVPRVACLQDDDPYVRKTAAVCVAKLFDINPELVEDRGFLDMLRVSHQQGTKRGSSSTEAAHSSASWQTAVSGLPAACKQESGNCGMYQSIHFWRWHSAVFGEHHSRYRCI
jgi:hypothetical protein